ncbi:pyridoxal-phosphate dependent enzyme [Micromonospora cathayae]|uniref:Pyridoxal-phosphate dependent enzyme n=1 Tax=Micromonospora cathayae TaxID=3028804 RepID=A0ABY7ZJY1_9ACTN|nr:pyridoxal-phosphate dependent enzyme [Micromonospora sp. HUAS 3]WDZ83300.1 pyridoxal-phosphate dependent enzyme [Micromonospora sp. HUAS 3]
MYDHIADAMGEPDLIRVDDGLFCLRFETMKIVSALAAVRSLLDQGVIRPGDTLLDSSSGIYAYALALACHRYGLRCRIVGSTTVDPTLRAQLAVLGARLDQMAPSDSLRLDQNRRVARIREILAAHPEYHWMRQYHDRIHYQGYRAVADRIRRDLDTRDLTVVGGVGSGASTGALARYLRQHSPAVRLVGLQPFGSITFGAGHVADPDIIIAGIGSSIPFDNVDHGSYDTIHWVGFEAARTGSVDLLRRHAVFAGLSTGAAYLAARWERGHGGNGPVLFVAADTGHRYVEAVFARHEEVPDLAELAPRQVDALDDLGLPWSRMAWGRRPAPSEVTAGTYGADPPGHRPAA